MHGRNYRILNFVFHFIKNTNGTLGTQILMTPWKFDLQLLRISLFHSYGQETNFD